MAYAQKVKLSNAGGSGGEKYGNAVAIDAKYAVVGEPENQTVYVYRRDLDDEWVIEATINSGADTFGSSVKIDKDYLVIGDEDAETIYIYTVGQWGSPTQTLTPVDGAMGSSGFGGYIAFGNNYLVVGAPNRNTNQGQFYVWEKNNNDVWIQYSSNPITLSVSVHRDFFGSSVSVNGDK